MKTGIEKVEGGAGRAGIDLQPMSPFKRAQNLADSLEYFASFPIRGQASEDASPAEPGASGFGNIEVVIVRWRRC